LEQIHCAEDERECNLEIITKIKHATLFPPVSSPPWQLINGKIMVSIFRTPFRKSVIRKKTIMCLCQEIAQTVYVYIT
jgi:hypothetical protein